MQLRTVRASRALTAIRSSRSVVERARMSRGVVARAHGELDIIYHGTINCTLKRKEWTERTGRVQLQTVRARSRVECNRKVAGRGRTWECARTILYSPQLHKGQYREESRGSASSACSYERCARGRGHAKTAIRLSRGVGARAHDVLYYRTI